MPGPVLNRRMTLEEIRRSPDGAGGFAEAWEPLGVHWAELKAGSGHERDGGFLTLSTVSYRITVRAAPHGAPSRPRAGQRFREDGRVFRIIAVAELDVDGRYLVCQAEAESVT